MNRSTPAISTLTLLLALATGAVAPVSAQDAWQLKLSGVYAEPTGGGASGGSFGGGLAIEYRATTRIGVELGGLTAEVEDDRSPPFSVLADLFIETETRFTPVLARLNFHLTPERRADVYVGPVAGWVSVDDLTVRTLIEGPEVGRFTDELDVPADDQLTWGAHAGVDVRLGAPGNRSFLSVGVTWLDLPLELELPPLGPAVDPLFSLEQLEGDLDPLLVQVGYSYRF